ncbi:7938_t:CDS:2, partial [Dentiscutata heterogama]
KRKRKRGDLVITSRSTIQGMKILCNKDKRPFDIWEDFAKELRLAFQSSQHQQYLRCQVKSIEEEDKILNFVEGLKLATKAE